MAKPLNILKGIASLFIGIPTAIAATVAVGTIAVAAKVGSVQFSEWMTSATGIKTLRMDAGWAAFSDSLWGSVGSIWTKWGVYPYIEAGKYVSNIMGEAAFNGGVNPGVNSGSVPSEGAFGNVGGMAVKSVADGGAGPLYNSETPSNIFEAQEALRLSKHRNEYHNTSDV